MKEVPRGGAEFHAKAQRVNQDNEKQGRKGIKIWIDMTGKLKRFE